MPSPVEPMQHIKHHTGCHSNVGILPASGLSRHSWGWNHWWIRQGASCSSDEEDNHTDMVGREGTKQWRWRK